MNAKCLISHKKVKVTETFFKNIVRKQPLNIIVHLFVYKKVCV